MYNFQRANRYTTQNQSAVNQDWHQLSKPASHQVFAQSNQPIQQKQSGYTFQQPRAYNQPEGASYSQPQQAGYTQPHVDTQTRQHNYMQQQPYEHATSTQDNHMQPQARDYRQPQNQSSGYRANDSPFKQTRNHDMAYHEHLYQQYRRAVQLSMLSHKQSYEFTSQHYSLFNNALEMDNRFGILMEGTLVDYFKQLAEYHAHQRNRLQECHRLLTEEQRVYSERQATQRQILQDEEDEHEEQRHFLQQMVNKIQLSAADRKQQLLKFTQFATNTQQHKSHCQKAYQVLEELQNESTNVDIDGQYPVHVSFDNGAQLEQTLLDTPEAIQIQDMVQHKAELVSKGTIDRQHRPVQENERLHVAQLRQKPHSGVNTERVVTLGDMEPAKTIQASKKKAATSSKTKQPSKTTQNDVSGAKDQLRPIQSKTKKTAKSPEIMEPPANSWDSVPVKTQKPRKKIKQGVMYPVGAGQSITANMIPDPKRPGEPDASLHLLRDSQQTDKLSINQPPAGSQQTGQLTQQISIDNQSLDQTANQTPTEPQQTEGEISMLGDISVLRVSTDAGGQDSKSKPLTKKDDTNEPKAQQNKYTQDKTNIKEVLEHPDENESYEDQEDMEQEEQEEREEEESVQQEENEEDEEEEEDKEEEEDEEEVNYNSDNDPKSPKAERQLTRKEWERAFNLWIQKGSPKNDPECPFPKQHPIPDHLWNKDPQQYLKEQKIQIDDPEDSADDY